MANSSRAHATQSHHGKFNPNSIFLLQAKPRLKEVSELLRHLFGEEHTRVIVHFADAKDPKARIGVRVEVAAAGATDTTNVEIAKRLLLRNALNAHDIHSAQNSSGKSKQSAAVSIKGVTTLERIELAERSFRRRELGKWALDVAVVTAVFCAIWEVLLWVWGVSFAY